MPSFAAHSAVAFELAPHQMRSRKPSDFGMTPRHVGVGLAFGRLIAEVAPAVDDLLRRAAADPELQPSAGDQIRGARVLDHVERILVPHVDDRGADLDPARPRADRGQQRKRRAELAREMVHAEVGAVEAELLGGDRQIDRLQERVGPRSRLRVA
jgi:hypothetical protein